MAAAPILALQGIRLTLGNLLLLEDAELSLTPGDKLALVGRNGSGKSTLLKIAAGEIVPDGGKRFLQPGVTLRYLPQEPDLTAFPTTLAYVEDGLDASDIQFRARYLLERLGLTGNEPTANLSGGEARRAALARVLAPEPDILLLDEPTNHLDLPAIEWLEEELAGLKSALVLISHDRRFLAGLTRATLWLDRGVTRRLNKGFSAFEAWRDLTLEEEETARHKLDRQIVREEHWLTYGLTARRKRNVRRLEQLQGLRQDRREQKRATGDVRMTVTEGNISGAMVVDADSISKRFGDRPIVEDFSTRIIRGDRVGLVGANGVGKTTLLRLLTGALAPDSGKLRLGSNLELASLDQGRKSLDPSLTLKEVLTGGGSDTLKINGQPKHVIGYMRDFLFGPEQARTPLGKLSGGERGRLMLAQALAKPSNLLVLDEPTNDLDMETLELLQELVAGFAGTVILVSHDRDFLDRTVTSVIAPDGGGRWIEYAGGYSDMLAQRGGTKLEDRKARPKAETGDAIAANKNEAPAPKGPAKKLSFKQKFALESLPKKIEAVMASISRLENNIADPAYYERDPASFQKTIAALDKERATLAALEEEWLELEMLREEMEG